MFSRQTVREISPTIWESTGTCFTSVAAKWWTHNLRVTILPFYLKKNIVAEQNVWNPNVVSNNAIKYRTHSSKNLCLLGLFYRECSFSRKAVWRRPWNHFLIPPPPSPALWLQKSLLWHISCPITHDNAICDMCDIYHMHRSSWVKIKEGPPPFHPKNKDPSPTLWSRLT
jgi:hypothetical protein